MNKNDYITHKWWPALVMAAVLAMNGTAHADSMWETLDQRYANHESQVNDRMGRFREELGITAAQQAAWDDYQGAIRRNLEDAHEQTVRENQHPPVTAPEHFEHMIAMRQEQMQDFKRIANTFNALYDVLSPAQRQVADKHFSRMREQMLKRAEGSK